MPGLLNNLSEKASGLLDELFAFISAPRCPNCGVFLEDLHTALCPACDAGLKSAGDGPVCLLCRSPEPVECTCRSGRQYAVPQMFYWATYTEEIRQLIHRFKFDGDLKLGEYLAKKAYGALAERIGLWHYDLVVPIPMLSRDKRKRSYNQTELIAQVISADLRISLDKDSLKKFRKTKLQANLGRDERWRNIKDAFVVENNEGISGKSVLLVDDIVTTGATSLEASKALYLAGAKSVVIFAIASSSFNEILI